MNKFQKAGLAIIAASGMAFAAGSLWGPNTDEFPSLQVKAPAVLTCWSEHPDAVEGNPCYNETGGWWFGYTDQTATTQVKISGSFTNFGDGVSLSDASDGSSLIGDALEVKFEAGAAASSDAPSIAGIGFNFKKPEGPENITSKEGYCITYSADGAVQFELGWDEATYNYDSWYVELPASSSKKILTMKWGETDGKKSGDFKKDGWGTGEKNQPSSIATNGAYSVKIRLKNGTTSAKAVNFNLYQLGWANDGCDNGGSSPVIYSGAELVKFNLVGRAFSLSSVAKPVTVQVINLQGAVVSSQVLASANEVMNLSNLPTGIYMVRVPALGYANKIVLK